VVGPSLEPTPSVSSAPSVVLPPAERAQTAGKQPQKSQRVTEWEWGSWSVHHSSQPPSVSSAPSVVLCPLPPAERAQTAGKQPQKSQRVTEWEWGTWSVHRPSLEPTPSVSSAPSVVLPRNVPRQQGSNHRNHRGSQNGNGARGRSITRANPSVSSAPSVVLCPLPPAERAQRCSWPRATLRFAPPSSLGPTSAKAPAPSPPPRPPPHAIGNRRSTPSIPACDRPRPRSQTEAQ
jgi:hypothetical protein